MSLLPALKISIYSKSYRKQSKGKSKHLLLTLEKFMPLKAFKIESSSWEFNQYSHSGSHTQKTRILGFKALQWPSRDSPISPLTLCLVRSDGTMEQTWNLNSHTVPPSVASMLPMGRTLSFLCSHLWCSRPPFPVFTEHRPGKVRPRCLGLLEFKSSLLPFQTS